MGLLSILCAGNLSAQIAYTNESAMSLRECIELALMHNLDIQIRRIQPSIDQFSLEAARGAYDPFITASAIHNFRASPGSSDPNSALFGLGSDTFSESYGPGIAGKLPYGTQYQLNGNMVRQSGTFFPSFQYNSDLGASITQPLLKDFLIDSDRRTIEINKLTLKIDELSLRQQIINTVTSVQVAYFDLIFHRENVLVQESSLNLAEQQLSENRKKINLGVMAPLDEKQAESQVSARLADVLAARRDFDAQMNVLKNLMSDDFVSWVGTSIRPTEKLLAIIEPLDRQESWRRGLKERPDILQSTESLERQKIVLRYNKNQLLPSLNLQLTYGHNGLGTDLNSGLDGIRTGSGQRYSYGLILRIPFSNRIAKNTYAASKLEKQRLLKQHKQLEQNAIVEIDNAVKAAQTAYEQITATRQARLYSEAALDAEEKKEANGQSTNFVVLQLQRDLTAARSRELRALADYNKALSNLYLSEGSTLERNKLTVELK